jgi:hypothetical protein
MSNFGENISKYQNDMSNSKRDTLFKVWNFWAIDVLSFHLQVVFHNALYVDYDFVKVTSYVKMQTSLHITRITSK